MRRSRIILRILIEDRSICRMGNRYYIELPKEYYKLWELIRESHGKTMIRIVIEFGRKELKDGNGDGRS